MVVRVVLVASLVVCAPMVTSHAKESEKQRLMLFTRQEAEALRLSEGDERPATVRG